MSFRSGWLMGALALGAAVMAAGLGFAGLKSTPTLPESPGKLRTGPVDPEDVDPNAPRLFDQSDPIRVHVAGAVRKPGVYSLPSWARVIDAIKKAGGAAATADLDAINLADPVKDGEQLRVPFQGSGERSSLHPPTPEPAAPAAERGGHSTGRYPFAARPALAQPAPATAFPGSTPLNLNRATSEELGRLPGIGPATAAAILAHRQEHGDFLQAEDLMNVQGIGRTKFERLRGLVTAP